MFQNDLEQFTSMETPCGVVVSGTIETDAPTLLIFLEILLRANSEYDSDKAESFHPGREYYCIDGEPPLTNETKDTPLVPGKLPTSEKRQSNLGPDRPTLRSNASSSSGSGRIWNIGKPATCHMSWVF